MTVEEITLKRCSSGHMMTCWSFVSCGRFSKVSDLDRIEIIYMVVSMQFVMEMWNYYSCIPPTSNKEKRSPCFV